MYRAYGNYNVIIKIHINISIALPVKHIPENGKRMVIYKQKHAVYYVYGEYYCCVACWINICNDHEIPLTGELHSKAERQYLLTLQVSRYYLLA